MASPWPDLIVGIDFGTTGTAVAYARPTEDKVHQFTKWIEGPGSHDKVPSTVVIENNQVQAWGFGVKDLSFESIPKFRFYKLFKPHFNSNIRADMLQAETCVRKFLEQLRLYLEQALPQEQPLKNLKWDVSKIKYVFSYPTTWDKSDQERFSDLIEKAGYPKMHGQDRMTSLDEAQASVIHFFHNGRTKGSSLPMKDEHILVADIGGGTSDVAIFKVLEIAGRKLELSCEVSDVGQDIGSTNIDDLFKTKLQPLVMERYRNRLRDHPSAPRHTEDILKERVEAALLNVEQSSEYEDKKCTYGLRAVRGKFQPAHFPLTVIDLVTSGPHPGDVVTFPVTIDRHGFFEDAFAGQCEAIWTQCQTQIEALKDARTTIQHVVLAGGLGSSPYVAEKLGKEFSNHVRSKEAGVIQVDDAPLAVSRGLVHSELLGIYGNPAWVYPAYYSYGIQKNGDKHDVSWFIKQGDKLKVPHTGVITRHIDLQQVDSNGSLKVDLKLVKHLQRPKRIPSLMSGEERNEWERYLSEVEDLSPWVQECLPVDLKHKFSFTGQKLAAVSFQVKMAHGAIALTLQRAKKEQGKPLILFETWHHTPLPKSKRTGPYNEVRTKRIWDWGLPETLAAAGAVLTAGGIAVAVMSFFNDKKKNEADERQKEKEEEEKKKEEEEKKKADEERKKEDEERKKQIEERVQLLLVQRAANAEADEASGAQVGGL